MSGKDEYDDEDEEDIEDEPVNFFEGFLNRLGSLCKIYLDILAPSY